MLGFNVSETAISRWMKRAPKDPQPAKRWLAFLHNHREAIPAMVRRHVMMLAAFFMQPQPPPFSLLGNNPQRSCR